MKTRAWSTAVMLLGVVALAPTVWGATSTRSFTNDSRGSHPNTVTGNNSQITVDLSALPDGTQVYRAIFVHNRGGHNGTASSANQPLRIEAGDDPGNWLPTLGPRHLYIDCTAAAQRAVQAVPKQLVLNMVSFPGFSFSAGVRVDVVCDQPVVNAVAALTNITAVHADGDTMVTWTERDQLLPDPNSTVGQYEAAEATFDSPDVIRYRIYRHNQPIDATTVRTAELVDEINPLSAWNPYYYGHYWRNNDSQIVPRLPVADEVLAAVDQGIYVRRAQGAASAYYAVSLAVNGEEDLSNWTAGQNTTTSAVAEAVGTGMVLLRVKQLDTTFMYVSNADLYYYIRWDCPPYYNIPSHAFDYLVAVPGVTVDPRPVDVALHCWGATLNGGFGWWYEADKGSLLVSTNMKPYDWWTAYHDNYGTVRPFTDLDGNGGGRVRNYPQKRILSFLNDFVKQNYSVDDNRILVTGSSMGGAGCIMWGARAASSFAYANGWVGVYIPRETPQFKGSFEGVYGNDTYDCEYEDTGLAAFDYWDSAQFILSDPGQEVPYLCFANGKNDSAIGWPQAYTFVNSLITARQPFKFKWGQNGHGERASLPAGGDRYIGIIIKKNVTLPAFTNCSLDDNMGNGDPADGDPSGNLNAYSLWETDTTVDQADRWEATIYLRDTSPLDTCAVDLTPRRCQTFSTPLGTQVDWTNTNVTTSQQVGSGTAAADQWGLVTLTGITMSKDRNRIVIVESGGPVLPVVTIQATDANAAEELQDTGTFTVSRDQTSGNLVVYYSVGGTAEAGDYEETLSGQVTILDGQPSATITITPVDDGEVEGNETVVLTLTADAAYTIGSPSSDTVTIADNDGGGPPEIFDVTRDNGINCADSYDNQGAAGDVRTAKWGCDESYIMDFDTAAITSFMGSNPISDYNFTLYIMPSSGWPVSSVSVDLQTINTNDDWAEGDDMQRFNSFGWTEGTPAATGEYAQTYHIGGALDPNNCIAWTREDGTPESLFKYLPANFTNSVSLTGSSADHGSYISVALDENLVNDLLNNAKNRGLRMRRTDGGDNLQNYTREAAAAQRPYLELVYTGGVPTPTVTIEATDPSAAEELQDTGTFTVSRDQTSGDLVVYYSVGGTAEAGDYEETLSGQVTILDGQPSATITITPVDDGEVEPDETVVLTLTADPAYTIGSPSSDTVTIADNDVPTVTLSATDPSAAEEGQDPGVFTVSRDSTLGNLAVYYSVGGTAEAGDYEETLSGQVTILDGQPSATITITPVDDGEVEGDETVVLTLTAHPAYTIGSPSSDTVTIADNDTGPGGVISFSQLEYKGAFRVHSSMDDWAARGMAFYPAGDGGNGSLIIFGHEWYKNVGESRIDVTLKKKSDGYGVGDLDVATVITPAPTTGSTPGYGSRGLEYVGLTDKLYHGQAVSNFGYCDRDGTNDNGPYALAGIDNRRVGEFIARIDSSWDGYSAGGLDPNQFLISGQNWAQYGCGVTIAAYDGDSPDVNNKLSATYLVKYDSSHPMTNWDRDDEWNGAAWLTAAADSAVLIAGSKDITNQGSDAGAPDDLQAWMMIYDPADLSDVVQGVQDVFDPQPVETLNIDTYMFTGHKIKSTGYDRAGNRLYLAEMLSSGERTVVHVWDVTAD